MSPRRHMMRGLRSRFPSAPRTRLWLLRPRADVLRRPVHPWMPPYDKTFSVIVRTENEEVARELALGVAGNEGRGIYRLFGYSEDQLADEVWLDRTLTDCVVLEHAGEPGVIVYDRREG